VMVSHVSMGGHFYSTVTEDISIKHQEACAGHLDAAGRLADSNPVARPVGGGFRRRVGLTTVPRSECHVPEDTMPRHAFRSLAALAAAVALLNVVAPAGAQAPTVFRSALVGEPPHIDPQRMADFGSYTVTSQIYSTLTILDDKLQIVPYAAEKWTVSRDGLTWTFKLRDNLVFHNGRKADANDVKYSLTRLASPESRSPSSALLMSDVVGFEAVNKNQEKDLAGVRVVDPLTVEIRLQSPPKGDLATRLSHISTAIIAREAVEAGGANWAEAQPVGTGPWKLKEWAHRSRVVYEAFPQFFEGKPKVDRLEMPIVQEPATQLAMYQNGELDVVLVPLGDYPRLKADPRWGKEMKVWDRTQVQFLALNPRVYAPFKDVRVRQAFAQAIDKQKVISQVFHGLYTVAGGMLPPGIPGHDGQLKSLPHDPARAKQLLAEAGFPGGKGLPPLSVTVNPVTADYRMMAEPIAAMLKDSLGVAVEVQLQEFASFTAAMNRRDALPAFMTGWSASTLDAGYFHELWLYSKSPLNRVNYESAAFDRLVEQANGTSDRARRIAFIKQADELITKDVPLIPVMYTRFVYLVSHRVKGLEPVPLGLGFNPFRAVEIAR
jgi:peptide/nickel transport system substrate-binding protein